MIPWLLFCAIFRRRVRIVDDIILLFVLPRHYGLLTNRIIFQNKVFYYREFARFTLIELQFLIRKWHLRQYNNKINLILI